MNRYMYVLTKTNYYHNRDGRVEVVVISETLEQGVNYFDSAFADDRDYKRDEWKYKGDYCADKSVDHDGAYVKYSVTKTRVVPS